VLPTPAVSPHVLQHVCLLPLLLFPILVRTNPALLQASGLAPAIDDSRLNGTVFTPTNAAINAFLKALNITQVELLAADPTLLANVSAMF
jgi:hypothetical protein